MPVKIEITGETVGHILYDLATLIGTHGVSAPAVSDSSSDEPKTGEQIVETPTEALVAATPKRGRKKATVTDVVDTTPVEPVFPPGLPVNETAQQDAADEAEDTEKARDPEKPLTIDDIKAEVNRYVEKWTFAAAKWDLQFVWREATGGKADRLSQLVDLDQPTMKTVIEATRKATDAKERRADGIAAQKAAEEAAKAKAAA